MTTCSTTLTQGTYSATFTANGDSVEFVVSADTSGWVAIGFSADTFMVCQFEAQKSLTAIGIILALVAIVFLLTIHGPDSAVYLHMCTGIATCRYSCWPYA